MRAEEGVGVVQNDHVEEVTPEKIKGTLTNRAFFFLHHDPYANCIKQ